MPDTFQDEPATVIKVTPKMVNAGLMALSVHMEREMMEEGLLFPRDLVIAILNAAEKTEDSL